MARRVSPRYVACNPGAAKPFRAVNHCSTPWPQVVERQPLSERAVSDIGTGSADNIAEIEILEAREKWSEYRLADGTVLRLKPVMIAIFRNNGQYTPDGDPIYNMKSTLITDVRAASISARTEPVQ
jgi:hypothetical protein